MTPPRHCATDLAVARSCYETLEPLHVVAYFNPHLAPATQAAGTSWEAAYTGARAGVLGPCPAATVTACFYTFAEHRISAAWEQACDFGLERLMNLRAETVSRTLHEAFGAAVGSAELQHAVAGLRSAAEHLSFEGRALAAAWSAREWPQDDVLALWHGTTIIREWRGDGHLAVLQQAGLGGVEACVFHEATHPNPRYAKRGLGRERTRQLRGWTEQDWSQAAQRLTERGLLEAADDHSQERLTQAGGELYDQIEQSTDDLALWPQAADAPAVLARVRPFVKLVIDAGVLPGTASKN